MAGNYQDFLDVGSANSEAELLTALSRAAESRGFPLVNLTCVFHPPGQKAISREVRKVPSRSDPMPVSLDDVRRDPVLHRVRFGPATPYFYDRNLYVKAGADDLWEIQAPYGYKVGLGSRIRASDVQSAVIGLDREEALPKDTDALQKLLADVQLLGTYGNEAAMRILNPRHVAIEETVALTPREMEVLKWASVGKSAWETGRILSISEPTVVKIVASARLKLKCSNKSQAVAKAFALGLISV